MDHWEMLSPRPRLAIGIIGGAQNFKLEGRKQQTFKVRKSRKRVTFLQSSSAISAAGWAGGRAEGD